MKGEKKHLRRRRFGEGDLDVVFGNNNTTASVMVLKEINVEAVFYHCYVDSGISNHFLLIT